jgi:hypothetical protein
MCNSASVQKMRKSIVPLLYKIRSVLHSAGEFMRWGNLINCSGEAAENTYRINIKGPGKKTNHQDTIGGTMMNHARSKETAKMLGHAIQKKSM